MSCVLLCPINTCSTAVYPAGMNSTSTPVHCSTVTFSSLAWTKKASCSKHPSLPFRYGRTTSQIHFWYYPPPPQDSEANFLCPGSPGLTITLTGLATPAHVVVLVAVVAVKPTLSMCAGHRPGSHYMRCTKTWICHTKSHFCYFN